jgi:hypothetical protein
VYKFLLLQNFEKGRKSLCQKKDLGDRLAITKSDIEKGCHEAFKILEKEKTRESQSEHSYYRGFRWQPVLNE